MFSSGSVFLFSLDPGELEQVGCTSKTGSGIASCTDFLFFLMLKYIISFLCSYWDGLSSSSWLSCGDSEWKGNFLISLSIHIYG